MTMSLLNMQRGLNTSITTITRHLKNNKRLYDIFYILSMHHLFSRTKNNKANHFYNTFIYFVLSKSYANLSFARRKSQRRYSRGVIAQDRN